LGAIKEDAGSSIVMTPANTPITGNAIALSAQFAWLAPAQRSGKIRNTATIAGNGAQNAITDRIKLNNGQNPIVSGGLSGTFIFTSPRRAGSSSRTQRQKAGIFLDPYGQIQIHGGTHNSVLISGNRIQIQNNPTFTPVGGS
jgi:hypothetical protein